jgi:hypothetical protein
MRIVGPNGARSPGQGEVPEQPITSRRRGFGRKALPPKGSVGRIDDFPVPASQAAGNADPADKRAAVDLFAGPHTIAALRPLAESPEENCTTK